MGHSTQKLFPFKTQDGEPRAPGAAHPRVGFCRENPQHVGGISPQGEGNLYQTISSYGCINHVPTLAIAAVRLRPEKKKKMCARPLRSATPKSLASQAALRATPFNDTRPYLETSGLRVWPKASLESRRGPSQKATLGKRPHFQLQVRPSTTRKNQCMHTRRSRVRKTPTAQNVCGTGTRIPCPPRKHS